MKDFFSELFYMCSSANDKSRGFYIIVTIGLFALMIGCVAMLGLNIFMLIKGWWKVLYLILFLVVVALTGGMVFWLYKNE